MSQLSRLGACAALTLVPLCAVAAVLPAHAAASIPAHYAAQYLQTAARTRETWPRT